MHITANMGPNGFGNEFVKLAKLMICQKELGIPIAASYWRTPYVQALPTGLCYTGRTRHAWRLAADCLARRRIVFGKNEHLATGAVAVEEALKRFLEQQRLNIKDRVLIEFNDFDPGLQSIERHGKILYNALCSAPCSSNQLNTRLNSFEPRKLLIGVHIRQGDFRPALPLGMPWPDNKWNIQTPLEWYDRVCTHLTRLFPNQIQFFVTTNSVSPEISRWRDRFNAVLSAPSARRTETDVADLLTLAACDLLIGSASWFSGWAVILQPKPWLWYACAHGAPPWGQETASVYAGTEPELPRAFLDSVESAIIAKQGGGQA